MLMRPPLTVFSRNRFGRAVAITVIACVMLAGCSRSPQAQAAKYLQRGESLLAKKDYSRAVLEFRNAVRVTPRDAEPYYRLGIAYLALGDASHAMGAFRQAAELNPKHAGAQLNLAELLASTRNKDLVEEAVARLKDILATSPDNSEALNALTLAELRLGRVGDAATLLEQALSKLPANLQSSVTLARVKLSQNDLSGAEQVLKQAVAAAPQSAPAALALGELYMALNQPGKAEPQIRRAIQLDPRNGPALIALGAILVAANQLDQADQTYRQLSALPGKEYRQLHALFLSQTGKHAAALAEFEKLAQNDPDDRDARNRLFAEYVAMNQLPQAQNLLTASLKRNPKDTDALLRRSQLSLKLGKTQEASQDLQEVLHNTPDSAEAHFALAGVYKTEGLASSERQELSESLRLKGDMLQARIALARSFIFSNKPDAAVKVLDEAPQQQKKILALIAERNWALLALGNTTGLRPVLNQALQLGRFPDLVLQDAILRIVERDYAGARANAEEVLKRSPEDARAARILTDTYAAQKDGVNALRRLAEIAAARPGSAPLQHLLGQWYMSSGNLAGARKAFEAAKSADPKSAPADFGLAEIDRRENRPDAARQRLSRIAAADPRNLSALLMLAAMDLQAGNPSTAIAKYRSVLLIDDANVEALHNLANSLAVQNPDEALKYAQQAAELAPDNAGVQDTLGWVYYRKGIYSTAVVYLKLAVSRETTPRRQFHLGMCYLKSGDQELGQKTLRAALKQDPNLAKTEAGW